MSLSENFKIDKSPAGVTRIILTILREKFADNLKDFVYKETDAPNSLIIDNASIFKPGTIQQRPAIYVKRGPFVFNKIAMGDRSLGGSVKDGTVEYQLNIVGSHTLFCMSRTEGEVERLAEAASDCLVAFKQVIRKNLDFNQFEVTTIGELGLLEEEQDVFVIPIVLNYMFNTEWQLKLESLKLKAISLTSKINEA